MENQKLLSQSDKSRILNVTLDNASIALMKGSFVAGLLGLTFRSKGLALFAVSYALGNSLCKSEDYLKDQL